jgi:capsule polysaccharide export protein KpsE/RkpR
MVEVMMKTGIKIQFCILGLALLAFTACAPVMQSPSSQMALAQSAVEKAAAAGSNEYAPVELKTARDKIDQAQIAIQSNDKDYVAAKRLLEQAEVDAELAQAKSKTAKSQKIVAELKDSINMLRDEIQRNRTQ